MRKITYFLSLCLLLIMGSTTALADDYTVKKLKSIDESELKSVDQIQDGHTYVLMFTYRGVYLQYNVLNGNWSGVNTLSPDDKNSSLAVVTFHQKKVDGDENTYYTLEAADGYYFKSYNQSDKLGIEASESPTLFQVVSGGTATQAGAGNGKTYFFIKPKDGTDMTYMTLNTTNVAIGFGKYGYAQVALIPVTTDGTVTNYEVTFALKEGDNTLSTSTSRAWEGETADVSAINNYSTALFDLTHSYENTTVSSTNKNFTCTLTPKSNTPIELSSASNRKWYSLQTRKTQYDAGQLVADGNNVKCHGAGFNATDIASYEQFENGLWSFEQSGGGVKIFNKGKRQYLNSPGPNTGDKATFDATGTVYYMGCESDGTFNLNLGSANSYVGSHSDGSAATGWKGKYLSAWTDAPSHNDPGSTFTPTSVDNAGILAIGSAAFSKTIPERSYTEDGVLKKGCYDADAKALVRAATTFAEMETRVNAAAANVSPEEGAYYLIRNVNKGGYGTETENYKKYLTTAEITCDANGDVQASVDGQSIGLGIKRLGGTSAFVPRLWQFKKTADGKYNLLNANTNSYVNVASMLTKDNQYQKDAYEIYTTDDAFGSGYNATNDSTTMFVMSSSKSTGYKLLNADKGYNYDTYEGVATWYDNKDAGNYWQFIKVTEVPLTIAANDYTTLCLPFNVKLPEGSAVKAYYASAAAGSVLKLEEITDGVIPANQGVILQNTNESEAANINLAIITEEGTTLTDNKLEGVTAKRAGYAAGTNYVLAEKNGKVGFYKANFTTIVANKAYLPQTKVQNAQGVMMAFSFGDEVTGIDNVNAATAAAKKYYDLQGRRVLYPAKGIFVTEDGQKVLFK